MRVLLIALLAAISYAQTEVECKGEDAPTVYLDFEHATMVSENLGGMGISGQPEEIYYAGVANLDGTNVNLRITTEDEYVCQSTAACRRYRSGALGTINMKGTSSMRLLFEFIDDNGAPIQIETLYMVWMDIDGPKEGTEEVYVENISSYIVHDETDLIVEEGTNPTSVRVRNSAIGGAANPSNLDQITDEQAKVMIIVQWKNVNSFETEFSISTWPNSGRYVLFTGATTSMSNLCRSCRQSGFCADGEYQNPDRICYDGDFSSGNPFDNCNAEYCLCTDSGLAFGDPIIWTFGGDCYDLNIDGRYLASSHKFDFDHDIFISIYNHYMRQIEVIHRDTGELMLSITNLGDVINNYPYYFNETWGECDIEEECLFFRQFKFDAQEFQYTVQIHNHKYDDPSLQLGESGIHLDIFPQPYHELVLENYNGFYFKNPIPNLSGMCRV